MNTYRSNSLDQFWIWVVLIHILGSCLLTLVAGTQAGKIFVNSFLWVYCAYANKNSRAGIFLSAIGWSVTLFMLTMMPLSYGTTFAMNLILFSYILYLHYGSFPLLFSENHVRVIGFKEILLVVILTVFVLLIGEYVNALSMVAFQNYVADSLSSDSGDLWSGIMVFAVSSALVEELMFRGYVFQRLGRNKKAIVCSAFIFALGHMNFNQMCYAFVLGFLFAWIYYVTDNLTVTIGIHGLFNAYNIAIEIFSKNTFVKKILNFQIAGYYPFYSNVMNSDGRMVLSLVLIGFVIALASFVIILAVMELLKREKPIETTKGKEERWKPGIMFFVAVMICVFTATLIEI